MADRPILFSGPMVRAIMEDRKTVTRRIVKPSPRLGMDGRGKTIHPSYFVWESPKDGVVPITDACAYRILPSCPHGIPGDRLWVREAFYITAVRSNEYGIGFKADHPTGKLHTSDGGYNFRCFSDNPEQAGEQWNWAQRHSGIERWIPSIHMPRWASRVMVEVVSVRFERLHDITSDDAVKEGVYKIGADGAGCTPWVAPGVLMTNVYGDKGYDIPCHNTARDAFQELWKDINGYKSWFENPWVWRIEFKRIKPSGERPIKPDLAATNRVANT